jgi:isoleucyl-tRNA synthetase
MDGYDVREAALALEAFVEDLSKWYIRRSRRRLQKPDTKQEHLEASATLEKVLISLSKLSAPFIPFFSEAIFGAVKKYSGLKLESSVHLADWDKFKPVTSKDLEFITAMDHARNVSSMALAERASSAIKVRQPLADLYLGEKAYGLLSKYKELVSIVQDEVNVKNLSLKKELGDKVELNKNITAELREEGMVRELVRGVSELRQKADLKPSNKIILMIDSSPVVSEVLDRWKKFVQKETGAVKIIFKKETKFLSETEIKAEEGAIWLAIRKE